MSRQRVFWVLCLAAALFGCRAWTYDPKPPVRFVQNITVVCEDGQNETRYFYNTDEKMRHILHFIRYIGIQDNPDTDPEMLQGRTVCMTVQFSDGSQKLYRMKENQYFQEGTSPWKQISAEKGQNLYQAILSTPSDPEPGRSFRLPHSAISRIRGILPW